jgi:hypothetical protein
MVTPLMLPSPWTERFALAITAALACQCTHGRAAEGASAAGSDATQPQDEVVRYCVSKLLPDVLAAHAPALGPACERPTQPIAVQLFEAGAHVGEAKGTASVRKKGLLAALKEFQVADDVAAKLAERAEVQVKKAENDADAEIPKALARLAADACLVAASARAIIDEGAACGSSAFETEEYQVEFARAYGAICQHTLQVDECARRAEIEYGRSPKE